MHLIPFFLFFVFTGILFFLPGFFLLKTYFKKTFQPFDTLVLSFAISAGIVDFLMLLLGKIGVLFTRTSLSVGIILVVGINLLSYAAYSRFHKGKVAEKRKTYSFSYSRHQSYLFLTLFILTLLIKTLYLSHAVLPTATDLGHHMYWSKLISETGKLPFYGKQEIISTENGSSVLNAEPTAIADFIIGEHLPFAAVNIFSGIDYFTAFPVVFLFLINVLSIFALMCLAMHVSSDFKSIFPDNRIFTGENVSLAVLFFFGPLYTLASPQAKFVSGGVVGNTFGNLFIPLIILSFYRAFKEKNPKLLALGFFLMFTLAYTHHLSTFVLLFALLFSALIYGAFNFNSIGKTFRDWFSLIIHPIPLATLSVLMLFFFLIAMPTYIETHAVSTAIGTPTKTTRTGLSFFQVTFSSGEGRVALGLAGTLLLLALRSRLTYGGAFLLGWSIILILMTFHPDWLFIDIPSNRIGAYLSFPLGMLASISFISLASFLKSEENKLVIPGIFTFLLTISLFSYSVGSGSYDNSQTLLPESKGLSALETFNASRYLAQTSNEKDIILKDHNYIAADSWMKLFFLRDYSYPFSRGFFKRYEDNPDREQCTLYMISVPNTQKGESCFKDTGTTLVVVNPHFDAAQFEKSAEFSRVYVSQDIHIYKRNQ